MRGIISICTLQTGDLFLASVSEPTINVSGEAGHKIDCWLATARQEKIVSLKGLSGYNPPPITRETCTVCVVTKLGNQFTQGRGFQSWALQELYPFAFFKLSIFSWRAIASWFFMLISGFAGHIDIWLAIARHEKIYKLEKLNGYNFPR